MSPVSGPQQFYCDLSSDEMTTKKCIYCKRLQTIVDYYLTLFDPMVAAMARGANKSTRLRILNSSTSTWWVGGGIKVDNEKKGLCFLNPIILGKTSLLPCHDWICYLWCEKAVGFSFFWGFIDKPFLSQECLLYVGQDLWEFKRRCPVSSVQDTYTKCTTIVKAWIWDIHI